jgi:hypothetical protein
VLNFLNWKTKKTTDKAAEIVNMKEQNDAVFSALASKQADLYDAIERAMKRELQEQKS